MEYELKSTSTVVSDKTDVIFLVNKEQLDAFGAALQVIDKFKKEAFAGIVAKRKYHPDKDSDWCAVSYCVKADKVIVSVESGMAG